MTSFTRFTLLAAGLGLAACNQIQPQTATPIPTTPVRVDRPIQQIVNEQPHSASVSQGMPAFTGATGGGSGEGGGRPVISYTGPGSGTVAPGAATITGSQGSSGGERAGGRPDIVYTPPPGTAPVGAPR